MNAHIYIISDKSNEALSLYKVGIHTGTEDKLRKRYITSMPGFTVHLFVKALPNDEKEILYALTDIRVKNVQNNLSEWVKLDITRLKNFVTRYLTIGKNETERYYQICNTYQRFIEEFDEEDIKNKSYKEAKLIVESKLTYKYLTSRCVYNKSRLRDYILSSLNRDRENQELDLICDLCGMYIDHIPMISLAHKSESCLEALKTRQLVIDIISEAASSITGEYTGAVNLPEQHKIYILLYAYIKKFGDKMEPKAKSIALNSLIADREDQISEVSINDNIKYLSTLSRDEIDVIISQYMTAECTEAN
ncbi:hypothetical protein BNJ_00270 [Kaumoebavirus]|uniref:hypothetical protein n=1 Tax=Kaumoebavirus TaxID=1859492 RepID=UPI0009C3BEFE|nr:hypothetical protein BNJ_00270 [Kaumoebavirus]ARA72094.1 hypothetical protein BNJ_00270 [Kaumoebavirus]